MSAVAVPERRGRQPRFTREVLDAIPLWIELGATAADIAEALGTTKGTLQVTCSAYKISLRPTHAGLRGALSRVQWSKVQAEASRRGMPVWQLVAQIVGAIADDNLFSAVLSEG